MKNAIPLEIIHAGREVRLERPDIASAYFGDRTLASFGIGKGKLTRIQAVNACNHIATLLAVATPLPARKV